MLTRTVPRPSAFAKTAGELLQALLLLGLMLLAFV